MTTFYATLSSGLRGCYSDNDGNLIKFSTRRELKAAVEFDARNFAEAGYTGASKKAVAAFVQEYWTRIGGNKGGKPPRPVGYLDTVLPLTPKGTGNASWGIFLSPLSRDDYRKIVKEIDDYR